MEPVVGKVSIFDLRLVPTLIRLVWFPYVPAYQHINTRVLVSTDQRERGRQGRKMRRRRARREEEAHWRGRSDNVVGGSDVMEQKWQSSGEEKMEEGREISREKEESESFVGGKKEKQTKKGYY